MSHFCNKDICLLTYPPQWKCSVCGNVDSTDYLTFLEEALQDKK